MKRRSGKYLNAREYAERLRLSDNPDIQDFAEAFLDALEGSEISTIKTAIDDHDDILPDDISYKAKVEWLGNKASVLSEVEETIVNAYPEYTAQIENGDIQDVIAEMLKRLRPVQEYDL